MKYLYTKILLVFVTSFLCRANEIHSGESLNNTQTRQSATEVVDFVENGEKKLQFGNQKDVVLMLGNTGSGKSTLTLFLTNDDLVAYEPVEDSGVFLIKDKSDRIGNSTITSMTMVPEMFVDNKNDIAYYDCPGFSDSRGVEHDITVTYLIHKLLNFMSSVKFVFVVSSSSVKEGGDRRDFIELAMHANTLIKNIDKYRNGIAMVVNKVENRYIMKQGQPHLVEDEKVIETVAQFLMQAKSDLEQKNIERLPQRDQTLNRNAVKFIDILLEKNNEKYSRIGILRLADRAGSLAGIKIMQQEKDNISSLINRNLQYVRKESGDFGYTISAESKNRVKDLLEDMQKRLKTSISDIAAEIKGFHIKQEQQITDTKILYEKILFGIDELSRIDAIDLRLYGKQLITTVNELGIGISGEKIDQFFRQAELTEFLTIVSNNTLSESFQIASAMKDTTQYLVQSKAWYNFLMNLHDTLSEYPLQSNNAKNLAEAIMHKCSVAVKELKDINDIGLKSLLDEFNRIIYLEVVNMEVDQVKLNALKMIVHQTMTTRLTTSLSSNNLEIRGYNVKVSDVLNIDCPANVKFMKVFALNKLYIDADVNKKGMEMQLSFIAPTWEIIGMRKIILDGKDGEPVTSPAPRDRTGRSEDGGAGAPGKPGGPGGFFVGVGERFINDKHLEVHVNGGKGGTGQNGGKGSNGIKGEDPTNYIFNDEGETTSTWLRLGFLHSKIGSGSRHPTNIGVFSDKVSKDSYIVYGKDGIKPGNGGAGGHGGFGGIPGSSTVIGLKDQPSVTTFSRSEIGATGKGGIGGDGTFNGNILEVEFTVNTERFFGIRSHRSRSKSILSNVPGAIVPAGSNGPDGINTAGIEQPRKIAIPSSSQAINGYKNFVRNNLAKNIRETDLRAFLMGLDGNKRIDSLYDTFSLVNELQSIENQYFSLRDQISFTPFIKSLLHRIKEYAETHSHSTEEKKVLSYLYTAAFSKLLTIQRHSSHLSIVDLIEYLKLVRERIEKLKGARRDVVVYETHLEYKNALDNKIGMAENFIKTQIAQEIAIAIDNIFKAADDQALELVDDGSKQQAVTIDNLDKAILAKIKVKDASELGILIGPLKIAVSLASFFCTPAVGSFVTAISGPVLNALESKADGQLAMTFSDVSTMVREIGSNLKQNHHVFSEQLKDIENKFKGFADKYVSPEFVDVIGKVKEFQSQIMTDLENADIVNPSVVGEMREKLKIIFGEKQSSLNATDPALDQKKEFLGEMSEIAGLAMSTVKAYNKIRDNKKKVKELSQQIEQIQDQLVMLKQYEDRIYEVMIPQLRHIEAAVESVKLNLEGKSHIQIDIEKWRIQGMLKEVKLTLRKMSKNDVISNDLQHWIEKLDEAYAILINIYDRIDSYADNVAFVTLITQNSLSNNQISTNQTLNEAATSLNRIIQTNLVLDQYEVALHAFEQHNFPFGPQLLNFKMPSNFNETEVLVQRSIDHVEHMSEQARLSKISIAKYDQEVFRDIEFSTNTTPFSTWKSHTIRKELTELLKGEEIVIKADITNGLKQNAVKFNQIGIHLKAMNGSAQAEMDAELEDFSVIMKMVGNNYYRCGTRFYYISVDENVAVEYSMKKGENGKPKSANEVYHKISENSYFLSPYAMWSIKLTHPNNDFEKLKRFASIDLELVGRGQYFKDQGTTTSEICNEQLDKYYRFDDTISYADNVGSLKNQF